MEEIKAYNLGDCKAGHKALLFMEDSSERMHIKHSISETETCYQCVCIECGEFYTLKSKNIKEVKNLVKTNFEPMEIFLHFEAIKQTYLGYVTKGLSVEEAVNKVNEKYNPEEKPKQIVKERNAIIG